MKRIFNCSALTVQYTNVGTGERGIVGGEEFLAVPDNDDLRATVNGAALMSVGMAPVPLHLDVVEEAIFLHPGDKLPV